MLALIIACLSAIGNLSLAALVLVKNSDKAVNRYFAGAATSLAVWSIVNYLSLHPVALSQLSWIRIVMAVVVMLCLFILLLANTFPTGKAYYKYAALYSIPPALIVAGLSLSPWLFTGLQYEYGQPHPIAGSAMILFVPYVTIILTVSVLILLRRFREYNGISREYVRYALVGIALTCALLLLTNFVAVLVFKSSSLVALSPLPGLIFTGSFAYGMFRYRLFDIRLLITRFISYLLTLLFVGGLYGLATVGLSYLVLGVQPSLIQSIISAGVVGILVLLAQPLRQAFNRLTRAFFYQDSYDTKDVLDKIASTLVRATTTDTLATKSLVILSEALKAQYISIVLIGDTEKDANRSISVGKGAPDMLYVPLQKLLHGLPQVTLVESLTGTSLRKQQDLLNRNVDVVARLQTQSGIIGYCLIGFKTSGSGYSQQDIDLVHIISGELAVAIQNTLRFDEIEEFNDTLQQRINEATKELRASNLQLQRLDQAKDEFVSMASHQLRTPLTSVKGYISMVLEGDAGKITSMQRQLLGEAFTSSERMVHLINDFLNVSRLQTGKFMLDRHAIDLSKVVGQEVDSLQATARAHTMKIHYRAPAYFPTLYIDEGKIRQVIMNFIDNAIYYSQEQTVITVKLYLDSTDAILEVHDTGIGVPETEQAQLFTKFFRATNARKQRPDGTGVGLFLAKKVIVAHGGIVVFDSVEGEGSTFGFRLPIKKLSDVPADDADNLD